MMNWLLFTGIALVQAAQVPLVHAEEAPTRSIVVAIDASGSVRKVFPAYQEILRGLIKSAPEGSSFCLIRFSEEAAVVARTESMSAGVAEVVIGRASGLTPEGRYTDFRAAVDCMAAAIRAAPRPCVLLVMTDALADPRPGVSLEGLDGLLNAAFPVGEVDLTVHVVVPDEKARERLAPDAGRQVVLIGDFRPENVIRRPASVVVVEVPQPPPPPEQLVNPRNIQIAGGIALALALILLAAYLARRARAPAARPVPDQSRADPPEPAYQLTGTCGDTTYQLGPIEEVREFSMGTEPGCGIPVTALDGGPIEIVLKRKRDGEFSARNLGANPVSIDDLALPPGKHADVRLPATFGFGDGTNVHLTLVPANATRAEREVVS